MPKKLFVETTADGEHQFVLRRAHSHHDHHHFFPHHHHHHHRRHHRHHCDDKLPISPDEMNHLLERERRLREDNDKLVNENHALKANWQACDQELRRLNAWIPQIEATNRALREENRDLRRSLEHSGDASEKVRELRNKVTKLRNEREGLLQTIRRLQREVSDAIDSRVHHLQEIVRALKQDVKDWQQHFEAAHREADDANRKYEALHRRHDRLNDNFNLEVRKNEALENENARLRRRLFGRDF